MEEEKKSFLLYMDLMSLFDKLSDEDAGKLIKAVFAYGVTGEIVELPPAADMLLGVICQQMDRDGAKWEKTKQARAEAGKASARARAERAEQNRTNSTNVQFVQQSQQDPTNPTVNVNGNVNDNVNVNENVNVNVINNDPTPTPEPRKAWGVFGNVLLSEGELVEWQTERPKDWEAKLTRLDEYLEQHPEKAQSYRRIGHLKKLREWAKADDAAQPRPEDTSVHFENEKKNKGYNNDSIFPDLFSDEIDDYLKGGSDETD